MKVEELIPILEQITPKVDTWKVCSGEHYGKANIKPNQDIHRILYCVTPSQAINKYAHENNYDLVIGHHPFVSPGISFFTAHTALDCCAGGLNDMWREHLQIKNPKYMIDNLGWYGDIEPLPFKEFVEKIELLSGKAIGIVRSSKAIIESVVICSGLGGMVVQEAERTNADCYLTGQLITPPIKSKFPAIIETGHTNSEWMGSLLFRKELAQYDIIVDNAPLELERFGTEVCCG